MDVDQHRALREQYVDDLLADAEANPLDSISKAHSHLRVALKLLGSSPAASCGQLMNPGSRLGNGC